MERLRMAQPKRKLIVRLAIPVGLPTLLLAVFLWGLGALPVVHADPGILYVDDATGQDTATCGTTGTPCKTISYTLNSRAIESDTIRVAQGVYTENLTVGKQVILEGGYESVNWTRNITQYETTVDGADRQTVVLFIPGSNGSVLNGLTVRHGQADDGGGIYVVAAQITIQNCTVMINSANESGGGISVEWGGADATIRDTQVLSNMAGYSGGGISVGNGAVATIVNSDIISNAAISSTSGGGGGIAIENGSSGAITGSHILSNTSDGWASGGILVTDDSRATLHSNEIAWNKNVVDGEGAIRVHAGSVVTLTNNHVHSNIGVGGGGVAVSWYSLASVYSNTIIGNEGMLEGGGGLRLTDHVTATVEGNMIVSNGASSGSGIAIDDSVVTATNNVIAYNYGPDGDGVIVWSGSGIADVHLINNTIISNTADGICVGDGTVLIRNNIFYGNGGAGIRKYEPAASVASDHNAFWNNSRVSDVPTGTGDIEVDPLLVAAVSGDYHLQADSPCIDAGTPTGAPRVDIEGTLRDATPDIGAYERGKSRTFLPVTLKQVGW
jgi:hypothetical protein